MLKTYRGMILFCVTLFTLLFFIGNICPIEHMVGIPCPGCNMFSALYWLFMKGNIELANYFHPAVFPLVLYLLVCAIAFMKYKEEMTQTKLFKISSALFLCVLLGVYIYRMIMIYPNAPMTFNENALLPRLFHLF